jgi:predicted DNA repair protein MutK
LLVLSGIALLMTVGVYGFVAGIVKLDDGGLLLSRAAGDTAFSRFKRALGAAILRAAPWLMKALSVAGTVAMFLVGGGILTHGVAPLHHSIEALAQRLAEAPAALTLVAPLAPLLLNAVAGLGAGALVFGVVQLVTKLRQGRQSIASRQA